MKDYYKMIGTSREAVWHVNLNGRRRPENEIDAFIKEKYEDSIKSIERKKQFATSQEKVEELNQEAEQIIFAYEQIKSPILREIYNKRFDDEKRMQISANKGVPKKTTAYDILNTTKETMQLRTDEENDDVLKKKRDQLQTRYLEMLAGCKNFNDKVKIESEIQKINEAYELLKNADRRKEYNEKLKREQEEEIQKKKTLTIQKKYSHNSEYNPGLIATGMRRKTQSVEKVIIREDVKAQEHLYMDEEERQLKVMQTGKIRFRNLFGLETYVDEYQVRRIINEQEKIDTVYTNELSKNWKCNSDYYNCVVNQLLSEETIEGSKFNGGYIGEVEKDKNGNYILTLENEKLKPAEQEYLTAVMIVNNREREVKEEGKEDIG